MKTFTVFYADISLGICCRLKDRLKCTVMLHRNQNGLHAEKNFSSCQLSVCLYRFQTTMRSESHLAFLHSESIHVGEKSHNLMYTFCREAFCLTRVAL